MIVHRSPLTQPLTLYDVKDPQKIYLHRQLKMYCSAMLDTLVLGAGGATYKHLLENAKHSRHTEKTVANNCDLVMDNLAKFYITAPAKELQL
jgi:hypothetical protein